VKSIFHTLLGFYGLCAGLLTLPLSVSWVYAVLFTIWQSGWQIVSLNGVAVIVLLALQGLINIVFRILFWLPSLLIWLYSSDMSFWNWLAPGFFIEIKAV